MVRFSLQRVWYGSAWWFPSAAACALEWSCVSHAAAVPRGTAWRMYVAAQGPIHLVLQNHKIQFLLDPLHCRPPRSTLLLKNVPQFGNSTTVGRWKSQYCVQTDFQCRSALLGLLAAAGLTLGSVKNWLEPTQLEEEETFTQFQTENMHNNKHRTR